MNEALEFKKAFEEQNRRDQITYSTLATILSVILNLTCAVMDHYMYPQHAALFLKVRVGSCLLLILVWVWFKSPLGRAHYRIFGVAWYAIPFTMILWMIYAANDPDGYYYAGLNIILLAVGLLSPWTYRQNLVSATLVLLLYLMVGKAMPNPQPLKLLINNATFLVLTAVIVVGGSVANARQRYREFELRWELDKNRKALEASLHQLKENEMQLVQSEKLASLGRLSAGIIHEINNPLNFATTGLYTLRKKGKYLAAEQQEEYAEILKDVEEGVKRVQTIVSDLRMFSHPNTEQLDPVSVTEVVTPALRFLSNEWKDNVQIEQKFAEHQTILANKNKLIQVMVNLFQNSLDAMRTKTYVNGEKPTIWIEGRLENGQSILAVRDNGMGIDAKTLDKIFDPFFTTKDVGDGMGLGLSICYSIVQEYGGKISVKTEPGKFCEFTLEFPHKA